MIHKLTTPEMVLILTANFRGTIGSRDAIIARLGECDSLEQKLAQAEARWQKLRDLVKSDEQLLSITRLHCWMDSLEALDGGEEKETAAQKEISKELDQFRREEGDDMNWTPKEKA